MANHHLLLKGNIYNEELMLPRHFETKEYVACFNVFFLKLILCCIFNEPESGVTYANLAREYVTGLNGTFGYLLYHFYDAIIRLSYYENASEMQKKEY